MDPTARPGRAPQRDFLAEAARLAFQMDPLAWDFDLTDEREHTYGNVPPNVPPGPWHAGYGTGNALATQGAVMLDLPTATGTQAMCSIYPQRPMSIPRLDPNTFQEEALEPSSSGSSDREWDAGEQTSKPNHRASSEESRLKIRERSKASQRRRWQKHKDKYEEQRRRLDKLEHELASMKKEKALLEAHAEVLEKALMKSAMENAEVQTKNNPIFIPSMGWTSFDPRGSIVLNAIFDTPLKLNPMQVARLTLTEVAKLWREYVAGIKKCLAELGNDNAEAAVAANPNHPAHNKLRALLEERHGLLSYVSAQNPHLIYHMQRSDLSTDPPTQPVIVSPEFHSNILKRVKLRQEQGDLLINKRNQYLLNIGFHSAALARLQGQLMALDPTPRESLGASAYISWAEGARLLQETVEEIHLQHIKMHFELYHGSQALSPLQAGRMLVESFPYLPDLPALVRELAAEKQAPSSEELLKQGAMKYAEQQGAADIKVSREPYIPVVDKVGDLLKKVELGDSPALGR